MALFFGYDPGGYGSQSKPEPKNGVVAVEIDQCGCFEVKHRCTVLDAGRALSWFRSQPFAVALGVDTLLAWSFSGHRACDDQLMRRYSKAGSSVKQQNSLKGSMAINGVLVALKLYQEFGIPLVESHPKLLLKGRSATGQELVPRRVVEKHQELKVAEAEERDGSGAGEHDHQADAFIAAWCASRWYFRGPDWKTDLYGVDPHDPLYFPAGPAVYPWPEPITSNDG